MSEINEKLLKVLKMNLSFAGCGFLGIYHVGVGVCFKKFASQLLLNKIAGTSAGALVAVSLLLDTPLEDIIRDFFKIVSDARSHKLGPFSPRFNIQKTLLECVSKKLPIDAHERVNGRLHLSLTRVRDGKSVIVSEFESREDLLDAMACTFFIPGFSGGMPPKFHNVRYMDGAFSNNLVSLNDHTVTVSPFYGESDICPKDKNLNYFVKFSNTTFELSRRNMHRLVQVLIPPSPKVLTQICQQGYDDALEFLSKNSLIKCGSCVTIQLNYLTLKVVPEVVKDPDFNCCVEWGERSMTETMPEPVLDILTTNNDGTKSAFKRLIGKPSEFVYSIFNLVPTSFLNLTESVNEKLVKNLNFCYDELAFGSFEREISGSSSLDDLNTEENSNERKMHRKNGN